MTVFPLPGGVMARKTKRIRKIGEIEDARRELWRAIVSVKNILMDPLSDTSTTLKSAHAMQQCVSSYVRLIEASDFEKRLQALEEAAMKAESTQ